MNPSNEGPNDHLEPADRPDQSSGTVRIARINFAVGSVIFLVVGALHLLTQFTVLSSEEVRVAYRAGGPIDVNGTAADGWDLFAGTSVLMGVAIMAVGALDLVGLLNTPRTAAPPRGMAGVTMVVLLVIAVVGAVYLTPAQLIGGVIGLMLFGSAVFAGQSSPVGAGSVAVR